MEKYDAIYGRQSVDRVDSISIESQVEYCQFETRGGAYKVFTDKGYSGKNTERPKFQEMLGAIRQGEVKRVIVYKLDRISRSILDFANMMEEFQTHGVEFVSCTEKFDTSTPMGRAMLNICIVFAQLERETIQMRVQDAYMSRSRKGFYMGGRIPYGYKLEPYLIDGKRTAHYVVEPEEANIVKLIYNMYARPETSFGDIARYLTSSGIVNSHSKYGTWQRSRLSEIVKNPIYVRADLDLYRFYNEQGSILHNSPDEYIGVFGCYLYSDKKAGRKQCHLEGQHIVLAPHEGIIPSDIWLKARRKCLNNKQVATPIKAKNTWLVGKIKCAVCGYAMTIRKCKLKTRTRRYLICSQRQDITRKCPSSGAIDADSFEDYILSEMKAALSNFETLSAQKKETENPQILALNAKIEQTENEINKLLDKVSTASDLLMEYINKRIQELDAKHSSFKQELRDLEREERTATDGIQQLKDYMSHWDELSTDDKRAVVDQLIVVIKAAKTDGDKIDVEITWKI